MSEVQTTGESSEVTAAREEVERPRKVGPLQTERGDTTIEETVVQKLAGMATREVPGVFALGSAARRAFSSVAERIPGAQRNVSGGVSVEKGERQTIIDVSIVVDYGVSIVDVSQGIRRNVIQSIEHTTGLEVLEVNVHVTDVQLPEDQQQEQTPAAAALE